MRGRPKKLTTSHEPRYYELTFFRQHDKVIIHATTARVARREGEKIAAANGYKLVRCVEHKPGVLGEGETTVSIFRRQYGVNDLSLIVKIDKLGILPVRVVRVSARKSLMKVYLTKDLLPIYEGVKFSDTPIVKKKRVGAVQARLDIHDPWEDNAVKEFNRRQDKIRSDNLVKAMTSVYG